MTEGGECRSWISGVENPSEALPCPKPLDGADAQFFCGTCSAPYCCSSETARLDRTQCPASQRAGKISPAPRRRTTPAQDDPPYLELVILTVLAIILLVLVGYLLRYGVLYARRRFRRQQESQNPNWNDFELQTIYTPPVFDHPHSYHADEPRYTEAPQGPRVLSPTSNVPPVAQSGWGNAGYQEDETQPRHPSKPAWTTGGLSPSQACVSRLILSPSDAEESHGARPWTSALAGCGPPRDCNGPPPYNAEDPYYPRPPATHRGNPWSWSATQGNSRGRLVDLTDVLPRHSAMASPTPAPEDPPPDSVAISHGLEVLPHALDCPLAVQFQHTTPRAEDDEMITVSLPALPGASPVDSVFEPVMKVNKLNLPITRL